MNNFTDKQKKIIGWTVITILLIISIISWVLTAYGFINNEIATKVVGLVFGSLSPSTAIGLIIKQIMNKYQIKQINTLLKQHNIKPLEIEKESKNPYKIKSKPYLEYQEYKFYVDNHRILITWENTKDNIPDQFELTKIALSVFQEEMRKDIQEQQKNTIYKR